LTPATNDLLSLSLSLSVYKFVPLPSKKLGSQVRKNNTRAEQFHAPFFSRIRMRGGRKHICDPAARWQNNYLHLRRLSESIPLSLSREKYVCTQQQQRGLKVSCVVCRPDFVAASRKMREQYRKKWIHTHTRGRRAQKSGAQRAAGRSSSSTH
jgi:hypothetical protein